MSIFRRVDPKTRSDLERVQSEITRLSEALTHYEPVPPERPVDDLSARIDAMAAQLDALDARITAVSTELANQLGELGNDIDALSTRPAESIDEETVEALRDTQLRLANEQARYQIAFRADLARLAQHLQRNRP